MIWGQCGAITILTGDDLELKSTTKCNGAGIMNFLASLRVIPASMTSGSLRNFVNFTFAPILTSALSFYMSSAAMYSLSCSVFRALRDDLFVT